MHVIDLGSGRVGGSGDRLGFFKTMLEACPQLVDFHFMCTTSFTVVSVFLCFFFPGLISFFF